MSSGVAVALRETDALLRAEGAHAVGRGAVAWKRVVALLAVAGFGYGIVMGAFAGRPLQALFSGVKVPLLLVVSTLICLPSFFVLNTILGLRDDFAAAARGVLSSQGVVATALLALAPVTLVGYVSSASYPFATVLNGAVFAVASVAGQLGLARHYRPLVRRDPRHRIALRAWLALYVFVAIQLAWILRPFVGAPTMRVRFLRQDAWGNAYVHVVEAFVRLFG